MRQNEFRDKYGLLDVCDVFHGEESQVVARRLLQRMERLGDGAWPQDRNPVLPSLRGEAPTAGQAEDAWMRELTAAWSGAADREIFDRLATAFGVRVNWKRVAAYLRAAGREEADVRGAPAPLPGAWTVVDVLQQSTCGHHHRTLGCAIACRERMVRRARRVQGTRTPRVILDLARGSSSGWVLVDPPDGWWWR